MCVHDLPYVYVYVHTWHTEKKVGSPGTGRTGTCELWHGCWRLTSSKGTSTKPSPDPIDCFHTLLNTEFYCPILSLGVLVTEHLMHTGQAMSYVPCPQYHENLLIFSIILSDTLSFVLVEFFHSGWNQTQSPVYTKHSLFHCAPASTLTVPFQVSGLCSWNTDKLPRLG